MRANNIPIEIIRTVVAISESGSYSKAADRLGLSQPAVSSQMKRLQNMVGGEVFCKSANGSAETHLGKLVVRHARKILEANDQLLGLHTSAHQPRTLRLGLAHVFAQKFISGVPSMSPDVMIQTDTSATITKALIDGYLDVACMFETSLTAEISPLVLNEIDESLVWVRSPGFVLSPGSPLPLINWPGLAIDDLVIQTLARSGMLYKTTLSTPDHYAKIAATQAGLGLMAMPPWMIPPGLIQANEYYLPKLPPIKILLCARQGVADGEGAGLLQQLATIFFPAEKPVPSSGKIVAASGRA
jgi:DNA-binding transcriptional LysR family regulator